MGLIKSQHAPTSVIPFSMRDIEIQASEILARAHRQAQELRQAAQKEAAAILQRAKADGLLHGKMDGIAQGRAEGKIAGHDAALEEHRQNLTQLAAALAQAAAELDASRNDLQMKGVAEVVDLATAIARRVTKRQGALDPAVLLANLGEAMNLVVNAADIRIALHPSQIATLKAELPRLGLKWPQLRHVELIEDAGLWPGGCRIFTRHGEVDASLQTQLDRVIDEVYPAVVEEQR